MGFFISSDRKFRNVGAHGVLRQVELHVRTAFAALVVIGELERMGIGNEIRRQKEPSLQLSLAAEVTLSTRIEAVEEGIVAVEDVIRIVKQVHHEAAVRDGEITRRFAAAGVEELM